MKDLRPIKGSYYISDLISQGEHEHQDFKFAISDARKIARSISAFANNDGGRLLIGVKDNGSIAGVRSDEDIYVVEQAAESYCRPAQSLRITPFRVAGGAVVIRVEIDKADERPVEVVEERGVLKSYFRVADENILVPEFMADAWRYRAMSSGLLMSLSGPERAALQLLESLGTALPEDFARHCRITRRAAEELVGRLHALSLIDFVYTPAGFRIAPAE